MAKITLIIGKLSGLLALAEYDVRIGPRMRRPKDVRRVLVSLGVAVETLPET